MNKNKILKAVLPHLAAFGVFLLLTVIYFHPMLSGNDLPQMDNTHAIGMAKELVDFEAQTGEQSMWTNSMFGGMPAYQIKGGESMSVYYYMQKLLTFNLPYYTMAIVMLYLLGFYILLVTLKVDSWLSIAGAIAFAFASYNLIIIEAGHVTKAYAIGAMAPVLAGIILTYRKKYIFGGILTMLALGLEIAMNHVQITYYLALIVVISILVEFIFAVKSKEIKSFAFASIILAGAAFMAVLPNVTGLWTTYEYGKESIRGASELTPVNPEEQEHSGLDRSYALSWSYGISESMTVLIPNFAGGGSNDGLSEDSETYKAIVQAGVPAANAKQIVEVMPTYWGDMPFTSGPVYFGAIICFLFILGLIVVKGQEKWWLLAATILSFLLAWGRHFPAFTDLFFYNFPMYNKFRTVSMILVIANLTMPLLGFLALKQIWETPKKEKLNLLKPILTATGITAGITLLTIALAKVFLNFSSGYDTDNLTSMGFPAEMIPSMQEALQSDRAALMLKDGFRSLFLILITGGMLWLFVKEKMKQTYFVGALIVLAIFDTWGVSKRYLNADDFVPKRQMEQQFVASVADQFILKDVDKNHRVFNISRNPFTEVNTSYFHHSIGGYHGAKLRRYQDIIDKYLQISYANIVNGLRSSESLEQINGILAQQNVLNMLNTKYIVYSPEALPLINFNAMGNAWFAQQYVLADNADAEIAALEKIDITTTAVIDKRFEAEVKPLAESFTPDTLATIKLIDYKPNYLTYEVKTQSQQLAIFSEIFYDKGWNAYVDGKLQPHFRANYILRAMTLPAGNYNLEFKFEPTSFESGQTIALISSILVILIVLAAIGWNLRKPKTETVSETEVVTKK